MDQHNASNAHASTGHTTRNVFLGIVVLIITAGVIAVILG